MISYQLSTIKDQRSRMERCHALLRCERTLCIWKNLAVLISVPASYPHGSELQDNTGTGHAHNEDMFKHQHPNSEECCNSFRRYIDIILRSAAFQVFARQTEGNSKLREINAPLILIQMKISSPVYPLPLATLSSGKVQRSMTRPRRLKNVWLNKFHVQQSQAQIEIHLRFT